MAQRTLFLKEDILFNQVNNYVLDFRKWDGKTEDICLYVDDPGDRFDK